MSRNFDTLPRITDYSEVRSELTDAINRYDSLAGRANICIHVARLYKELAETSNDPNTRKLAREEGIYFTEMAIKNANQREFQDVMLPEFFNKDLPIT